MKSTFAKVKTILLIALAAVMLVSVAVLLAVGSNSLPGVSTGDNGSNAGAVAVQRVVTVSDATSLANALTNAQSYDSVQLTRNIDISQSITISVKIGVSIDLNGYVLKYTGTGTFLTVTGSTSSTALGIKDSRPTVSNTLTNLPTQVASSRSVTLTGGVLTAPNLASSSYLINLVSKSSVYDSQLMIEGGNIAGCANGTSPAGVIINTADKYASVYIEGGQGTPSLCYNYATSVIKLNGGLTNSFYMNYNTTINNNVISGTTSGVITLVDGAQMALYGGSIINNTGTAVYVDNSCVMAYGTFGGATISNNKATTTKRGGGIYLTNISDSTYYSGLVLSAGTGSSNKENEIVVIEDNTDSSGNPADVQVTGTNQVRVFNAYNGKGVLFRIGIYSSSTLPLTFGRASTATSNLKEADAKAFFGNNGCIRLTNGKLVLNSSHGTLKSVAAVAKDCLAGATSAHYECPECNACFATNSSSGKAYAHSHFQSGTGYGHTFTTIAATSATCTTSGLAAHRQCSRCKLYFASNASTTDQTGTTDESTWANSEPTGHSRTTYFQATSGSGCTVPGYQAHYECTDSAHNVAKDGGKCFDSALDMYYMRNAHDHDYYEDAAPGHKFGTVTNGTPATCVSAGTADYKKCSVCNLYFKSDAEAMDTSGQASSTITLPATGHNFAVISASSAQGCTQAGVVQHYECTNSWHTGDKCFASNTDKYGSGQPHAAFSSGIGNHVFGSTTPEVPATCTTDGKMAYKTCSSCNKYFGGSEPQNSTNGKDSSSDSSFTISKIGHTFSYVDASAGANCQTRGYISHFKCVNTAHNNAKDGDVYFAGNSSTYTYDQGVAQSTFQTGAYGNHNFGATTGANDPTCTADGNYAYKQCSTCSKYFAGDALGDSTAGQATNTFIRNKLGHSFTNVDAVTGNGCTTPGLRAHKECSRTCCSAAPCFDTTADDFDTNGHQHSYYEDAASGSHTFNGTGTWSGWPTSIDNDTVVSNVLNGLTLTVTCSACGTATTTVTSSNGFTDDGSTKTNATCTVGGSATLRVKTTYNSVTYTDSKTYSWNALGHAFTDFAVTTGANCQVKGFVAHKECSRDCCSAAPCFDTTAGTTDTNGHVHTYYQTGAYGAHTFNGTGTWTGWNNLTFDNSTSLDAILNNILTLTVQCSVCNNASEDVTSGFTREASSTKSDATCTQSGSAYVVVSITHNNQSYSGNHTYTWAALGHDWTSDDCTATWVWTYNTSPTVITATAVATITCGRSCGESGYQVQQTVSNITGTLNSAATCTADATYDYTASVTYPTTNGKTHTDTQTGVAKASTALGHDYTNQPYLVDGDNGHYRECVRYSDCSTQEDTVSHSDFLEQQEGDDSQHFDKCSVCQHEMNFADHDWLDSTNGYDGWTIVSDAQHRRTCATCEKKVEGAHEFEATFTSTSMLGVGLIAATVSGQIDCPICGDNHALSVSDSDITLTDTMGPSCEETGWANYSIKGWYNSDSYTGEILNYQLEPLGHQFTGDQEFNDDQHYNKCTRFDACSTYGNYQPHSKSWITTDDDEHWEECSDCAFESDHEAHGWAGSPTNGWTKFDNAEHIRYCATCQKNDREAHGYAATFVATETSGTGLTKEKVNGTIYCATCDDTENLLITSVALASSTAATCTSTGRAYYTATGKFNEVNYTGNVTYNGVVLDYTLDALGHIWATPVVTWTWTYNPFTKQAGATAKFKCGRNGCNESQQVTATNVTREEMSAATCTANSRARFRASVTFSENGLTYSSASDADGGDPAGYEEMGTALGHDYSSDWSMDSSTHWNACSRCSYHGNEDPHNYANGECQTCGYVSQEKRTQAKTEVGNHAQNQKNAVDARNDLLPGEKADLKQLIDEEQQRAENAIDDAKTANDIDDAVNKAKDNMDRIAGATGTLGGGSGSGGGGGNGGSTVDLEKKKRDARNALDQAATEAKAKVDQRYADGELTEQEADALKDIIDNQNRRAQDEVDRATTEAEVDAAVAKGKDNMKDTAATPGNGTQGGGSGGGSGSGTSQEVSLQQAKDKANSDLEDAAREAKKTVDQRQQAGALTPDEAKDLKDIIDNEKTRAQDEVNAATSQTEIDQAVAKGTEKMNDVAQTPGANNGAIDDKGNTGVDLEKAKDQAKKDLDQAARDAKQKVADRLANGELTAEEAETLTGIIDNENERAQGEVDNATTVKDVEKALEKGLKNIKDTANTQGTGPNSGNQGGGQGGQGGNGGESGVELAQKKDQAKDEIDQAAEEAKQTVDQRLQDNEITEDEANSMKEIIDNEATRAKEDIDRAESSAEVDEIVENAKNNMNDTANAQGSGSNNGNGGQPAQGPGSVDFEQKKEEAKQQLEDFADEKKEEIDQRVVDGTLTPEEAEDLKEIIDYEKSRAQSDIDDAEDEDEIKDIVDKAKDKMDEVANAESSTLGGGSGSQGGNGNSTVELEKAKNDAKKELDDAARDAKKEVDDRLANGEITEEEAEILKDIIDNENERAQDEIDRAETVEEVEDIVAKAKDNMDNTAATPGNGSQGTGTGNGNVSEEVQFEQAKEKGKQDLEDAAKTAKDRVDARQQAGELTPDEAETLKDIIDNEKTRAQDEVNNATTQGEIDDAVANGTNKMNDVAEAKGAVESPAGGESGVDLEKAKDEAKKDLDKAAKDAKDEIDRRQEAGELTEQEAEELKDIIDSENERAKEEVEAATTVKDVEKARDRGVKNMGKTSKAQGSGPNSGSQGGQPGSEDDSTVALEKAKQQAREELDQAAEDAKAAVDAREQAGEITSEEAEKLKEIIDNEHKRGEEAVDAATTEREVKDAVKNAKNNMDSAAATPGNGSQGTGSGGGTGNGTSDEVAFEQAKEQGKQDLEDWADQKKDEIDARQDLTDEEKETLKDLVDSEKRRAQDEIDNATSQDEIDDAVQKGKDAMDNIAQTDKDDIDLAKKKDKAKTELEQAADDLKAGVDSRGDIDQTQKDKLKEMIDNELNRAKGEVDNATTPAEVDEAVTKGKDNMRRIADTVEPDFEEKKDKAKQELEDAADQAKQDIDDRTDIDDDAKQALKDKIDDELKKAEEAIDNATTPEEVDDAVADGKGAMQDIVDTSKEDIELELKKEEAKKELEQAAQDAKDAIDDRDDLTRNEMDALKEIIDNELERAKEDVDNATTPAEVDEAVANGKQAFEDVANTAREDVGFKQKKDRAKKEVEDEAKKAKEELDQQVEDGKLDPDTADQLKDKIDDAKKEAQDAIDQATTDGEIEDALQKGKDAISGVLGSAKGEPTSALDIGIATISLSAQTIILAAIILISKRKIKG